MKVLVANFFWSIRANNGVNMPYFGITTNTTSKVRKLTQRHFEIHMRTVCSFQNIQSDFNLVTKKKCSPILCDVWFYPARC